MIQAGVPHIYGENGRLDGIVPDKLGLHGFTAARVDQFFTVVGQGLTGTAARGVYTARLGMGNIAFRPLDAGLTERSLRRDLRSRLSFCFVLGEKSTVAKDTDQQER
jgi:hypothetical protein